MGTFKYLKFVLLTAAVAVFAGHHSKAQTMELMDIKADSVIMKLDKMTVKDFRNLVFPPLDVLFENARMANIMKQYDAESEYYRYDAQIEKRKPLEWIRAVASYNYGNVNLAAVSLMQTTYQVYSYNNSTQKSNNYLFGVNVSIPLNDIFNIRSKVRQAKSKMEQVRYRQEAQLDEVKRDIVHTYCLILSQIKMLESQAEQLVIAKAQFNVAENDFLNNTITAETLYQRKSFEATAINSYENTKQELCVSILTLELLSCTPIVSNYKLIDSDKNKKDK